MTRMLFFVPYFLGTLLIFSAAFASPIQPENKSGRLPADTVAISAPANKIAATAPDVKNSPETVLSTSSDNAEEIKIQRAAARWALLSVVVSSIQTVLSVFGAWLVWETLKSTRSAVIEAGNSSRAAEAAVDVAKSSAEKQLRAYVYIELVSLNVDRVVDPHGVCGLRFCLVANLNNVGSTPAERVQAGGYMKAHEWPGSGDAKRPGKMADFSPIAPAYRHPITFAQYLLLDDEDIITQKSRVFVTITASYFDVFGHQHDVEYHATVTNMAEMLNISPGAKATINLQLEAMNHFCIST